LSSAYRLAHWQPPKTLECSKTSPLHQSTLRGSLQCFAVKQSLINASAQSDARFREYVKAGTVLCARSIEPFERGRPVCGGRGPYKRGKPDVWNRPREPREMSGNNRLIVH